MINFNNIKFVTSSKTRLNDKNIKVLPEILFIGRSNVGKSTLINSISNHNKMAYVSSKPGHTKLLNYYNVDDKFYLVDAPGYGFSQTDKNFVLEYEKIMDSYFEENPNLKLVLILIDGRRGIQDYEEDLRYYLTLLDVEFRLVFTKMDKLNQSEKANLIKSLKKLLLQEEKVFYSRYDRENSLDELKSFISDFLNL